MKKIILKKVNGKYKIFRFVNFFSKCYHFYYEYNGNLCDKYTNKDKELKQISLLVEALNIKNKKERIKFIYEKSCDLLDDDFYGKNICEFKNNKCIHDRVLNCSCDGCCKTNDGLKKCKYLVNHRCTIRCIACKFHICHCIRKKRYKIKVNDIYMIKYLYNWKQKIIIYNDFFIPEVEVLNHLYKNSIILWLFCKNDAWIKNEN